MRHEDEGNEMEDENEEATGFEVDESEREGPEQARGTNRPGSSRGRQRSESRSSSGGNRQGRRNAR